MSIVQQLLDKTQFVETIDEMDFRLRLITAEVAAEVIGNKVLGLMRGGTSVREIKKEETQRIMEGYLSRCMVSPKFGPESSVENDTVCLADLGRYSDQILAVVFERSGFEGLGNEGNSSEDTEEEN